MSSSTPPPPPNPLRGFAIRLRAAAPGGGKLSKEQKQFNKLVKDIDALRTTIAQWQAFEPKFRLRLATEIEPLIARYRASRLEVVMLLKSAIDGKELGKRQKSKAREILCWHVSELLADGADEALIALYDQYADRRGVRERPGRVWWPLRSLSSWFLRLRSCARRVRILAAGLWWPQSAK